MSNSDRQPYHPPVEEDSGNEWIMTFADMMTLLLTFFVMLVAISTLDSNRFEEILHSIQYSLGAEVAQGGRTGRIDLHDVQKKSLAMPSGSENEPLLKDIRETINKKNLDDAVQVVESDGKVVIRVKGQVLFASGASTFDPQAKQVLSEIARLVKSYPGYRLDIGGHTDSRPISTPRYRDNWDLSALRAAEVLRYLVGQGVSPRRLTATGYGSADPLVPNTSPENMAKNRRVEFVLEKKQR